MVLHRLHVAVYRSPQPLPCPYSLAKPDGLQLTEIGDIARELVVADSADPFDWQKSHNISAPIRTISDIIKSNAALILLWTSGDWGKMEPFGG